MSLLLAIWLGFISVFCVLSMAAVADARKHNIEAIGWRMFSTLVIVGMNVAFWRCIFLRSRCLTISCRVDHYGLYEAVTKCGRENDYVAFVSLMALAAVVTVVSVLAIFSPKFMDTLNEPK